MKRLTHWISRSWRDGRKRQASAIPAAWLDEVRLAIRLGLYAEAEAMLLWISQFGRCASGLNLAGVIQEAKGHRRLARKFYRKALRVDPDDSAASDNIRRCYELDAFGRTNQTVSLGDERPALQRLLHATRQASRLESIDDSHDVQQS
jgi:tetratricopeptide (TPR) repeat protein